MSEEEKPADSSNDSSDYSDELLGKWLNWAGDDGGLAMVFGYGVEFKEHGEGLDLCWGTEEELNRSELFYWQRIAINKILISWPDESDTEVIEYEISTHIGGYGARYWKITDKDKQGFWSDDAPLYKYIEPGEVQFPVKTQKISWLKRLELAVRRLLQFD